MQSQRAKALSLKARTIESPSGCWEWIGGRHGVGYGCVPASMGGGRYAHRAMYESVCGTIPQGMYVLHTCDNRLCINPEHLWLGTHRDNIADMNAKSRQKGGSLPNERNPSCRFTDGQIRSMREARKTMSLRAMVRHFGISETHLLRVMRGESRRGV